MSFYCDNDNDDDDDDDDKLTYNDSVTRCPNCGSTENYKDENSGALVCSSCFTQSQAHTQEELDLEEVQALAARTQSGQVMGIRNRRTKGTFVKVKLEELDKSTPFPSLETCLEAYKIVLQVATKSLCALLDLNEELTSSVHASVKTIWISFLQAWKDGADFYGKLHPEVRFCLMDAFICQPSQRVQILRYLSYEALKKIDQELSEEEDRANLQSNQDRKIITGGSISISQLLALYNRKGRLEAALKTRPSMIQVAGILLLATSRLGIAAHHLVNWIANDKLPLLNAFRNCLTKELQEKVQHIAYFFRIEAIPLVDRVEHQANLLLITSRSKVDVSPPDLLTQSSIPLLTTRLVMDLGFRQQVLDNALALMGLYRGPPRYWLPKPLVRLAIKEIRDILGVIVLAVKMCPDWQSWKYYMHSPEIPWNDAMAQQMLNGHLPDFMDFCEKNGKVDPTQSCIPAFTGRLQVLQHDRSLEPIPTLVAGTPNPAQPGNMERRQKHHDLLLRVRKRNAVWADANGLGKYIVYDKREGNLDDISDLHPHYVLLLEHLARTCLLPPVDIHKVVVELDEEVQMLGQGVDAPATVKYQKSTMTPRERLDQLHADAATNPCVRRGSRRSKEEVKKSAIKKKMERAKKAKERATQKRISLAAKKRETTVAKKRREATSAEKRREAGQRKIEAALKRAGATKLRRSLARKRRKDKAEGILNDSDTYTTLTRMTAPGSPLEVVEV